MTDAELAELVTRALCDVAPDLEGETIDPIRSFRDQFEIDSMDFLNFVVRLHKATGVDIPEQDYPKVQNLADIVAYLRGQI